MQRPEEYSRWQQWKLLDDMDSLSKIFRYDYLPYEDFYEFETNQDIANFLVSKYSYWTGLKPESLPGDFEYAIKCLSEKVKHLVRRPLNVSDLDQTLIDLFLDIRKRRACNDVSLWIRTLDIYLGNVLERSEVDHICRAKHERAEWLVLSLGTVFLLLAIGGYVYWFFPSWMNYVFLGSSIGVMLMYMFKDFKPNPCWYMHQEPELTLRQAIERYGKSLSRDTQPDLHSSICEKLINEWNPFDDYRVKLGDSVPWQTSHSVDT